MAAGFICMPRGCIWDCNSDMARKKIRHIERGIKERLGSVNGSEPVAILDDLCAPCCSIGSGRIGPRGFYCWERSLDLGESASCGHRAAEACVRREHSRLVRGKF